jgi:hypothetical protein
MIFVTHSQPVNEPGEPLVTSGILWDGLVAKANNALPYIGAMTHCEVLQRHSPTVFDREIELDGRRFVERVSLEEPHRIVFTRLSGEILGTITDEIAESDGELELRFSFALAVPGIAAGSPEERECTDKMTGDYLNVVGSTLEAARKIAASEWQPHARQAGPVMSDWISHYYADIDGMRLQSFVNRHTEDAVFVFGSKPPVVGKVAIGQAMTTLWSIVDVMHHQRRNLWFVDDCDTAIIESDVHYKIKSGKEIVVPSISVVDRGHHGLVTSLRVHLDLTPLFEERADG